MNLNSYFEQHEGIGILATADDKGKVDMAIYETPQVVDDNTIALNMLERLSYKNVQTNPNAAYMFIETGGRYQGRRFYLTKVSEKPGIQRVRELRARHLPATDPTLATKHVVCFKVESIRPLVGDTN